jgi:hypothetical protein
LDPPGGFFPFFGFSHSAAATVSMHSNFFDELDTETVFHPDAPAPSILKSETLQSAVEKPEGRTEKSRESYSQNASRNASAKRYGRNGKNRNTGGKKPGKPLPKGLSVARKAASE